MAVRKLTLKQDNACNYYIETGDKSEAYRRAYSCDKMKPETINNKAYQLFENGDIRARVKQLRDDLRRKSDIKKEEVLEKLSAILDAKITDYVIFNGRTVKFKPFDQLTQRQVMAIESIKKSRTGIELKLHGQNWTIERICKMLGFDSPDKLELISPFSEIMKKVSERRKS